MYTKTNIPGLKVQGDSGIPSLEIRERSLFMPQVGAEEKLFG